MRWRGRRDGRKGRWKGSWKSEKKMRQVERNGDERTVQFQGYAVNINAKQSATAIR